jgi:hypothetical protein
MPGVVVGGRLVATQAHLAPSVAQAHGRSAREGETRAGVAVVRVERRFEPEAGLQPAAHVLDTAEAQAAGRQPVLRHRILGDAVVVEPAAVQVDHAEHRDRGLSRCGGGDGGKQREGRQVLFHGLGCKDWKL